MSRSASRQAGRQSDMPTTVTMPDLPDLRAFMRHTGWEEYPPGPVGSLWSKENFRVGVPHEGDDTDAIVGVIQRIAMVEHQAAAQLAERISHFRFDVTHLRAANDYKITS